MLITAASCTAKLTTALRHLILNPQKGAMGSGQTPRIISKKVRFNIPYSSGADDGAHSGRPAQSGRLDRGLSVRSSNRTRETLQTGD
jgi:hypothetical protein